MPNIFTKENFKKSAPSEAISDDEFNT